jgi:hypothetical protein
VVRGRSGVVEDLGEVASGGEQRDASARSGGARGLLGSAAVAWSVYAREESLASTG